MTQPIAADPSNAASDACGALLEAAAALRPVIRDFQDETERGRRIPLPLVEQFRAAGFYRMVAPRVLGGIQADPLTYLRVVELAAEGDGSAGWNLANHGVGQLAVLSLPDEGVHEIFDHGPDVIVAGTLQPGGGRALPVDGG
jgi:alkylation response protein AidB-like acyl-CoA dehydrogenase